MERQEGGDAFINFYEDILVLSLNFTLRVTETKVKAKNNNKNSLLISLKAVDGKIIVYKLYNCIIVQFISSEILF
jgi:hypothetical protein